jgi:hypothetical protein
MHEGYRLDCLRVSAAVGQCALAEAKMPEQAKCKEQQNQLDWASFYGVPLLGPSVAYRDLDVLRC